MAAIKGEPALTTSTITSIVAAAVTLLVAFGLSLSNDQVVAITGFVAVIAPLVAGFVTRAQVTPSAEVAVKVDGTGELVAADALTTSNGTPVEVYESDAAESDPSL